MSDSVFDDLCKHGWLWEGPCAWCEKERLTAELAEKDKRIESLEQALAKASLRTQELEDDNRREWLIGFAELEGTTMVPISHAQIDAAWKVATSEEPYADDCLAELHIVACEECGGGVSKAWDNGCPSCHGHGWII